MVTSEPPASPSRASPSARRPGADVVLHGRTRATQLANIAPFTKKIRGHGQLRSPGHPAIAGFTAPTGEGERTGPAYLPVAHVVTGAVHDVDSVLGHHCLWF